MKIAQNSSREIKQGAVMSYLTAFINLATGLLYTPWMIRQIGKSDYALFALVTSLLSYFMVDLGLDKALSRFIAKYRAEDNEEGINNLLGLAFKLYILIDFIIAIFLVALYFFLEGVFFELSVTEISRLKVVYIIAGLFSLISFPFTPLSSIMIAYERFVPLRTLELLKRLLIVISMVIALLIGFGLFALVAVNAIVGLIVIVAKIFYISRKTTIRFNFSYRSARLTKELFSTSIWITVIMIAQRLTINITPTILGAFSGTEQIAVFSIGMTIEGYTWTFANAINGLFIARISRLVIIDSDTQEVNNLLVRVGRLQLIVIGLLISGFFSLGKEFILLWLGEDFSNSYYVSLLLISPGLVILTQEIAYTMLFVLNELKYRALLFIVSSIISVVLSIVLSPTYGAIGSAIGISISLMICQVIGMNIVYSKVLNLDIIGFFKKCHLKMMPAFCLSTIIAVFMQKLLPTKSIMFFVGKALFFSVLYFLMMWFMALNRQEKRYLGNILKKIAGLAKMK